MLLTKEMLDFFDNVGLCYPAGFQISIDGNRKFHDKSRVGINKAPTYDIIVSNIKMAAERGFTVNVRLNYTAVNAMSFFDVLDDFAELPLETKRFINFSFQQVWQDKKNDASEQIEYLIVKFKEENWVT